MSSKAKIAFLYTEIAGYTVACLNELAKSADILLFRWPVNSEAPFNFTFPENVKVINRRDFADNEISSKLQQFGADVIICSGWMDKGYVKVSKSNTTASLKVICIDNHWVGSIKQHFAQIISPFYLKNIFTHAWVPGEPQFKFAQKLGFKNKTLQGFYCADTALFNSIFERTFKLKEKNFPKRILYVARYVEHKGIFEMWKAFKKWQEYNPNDWELWCVGTGEEWGNRMEHPKIKHLGFLQPNELEKAIQETGVYILPSKFEPWGVSVQEFAVAGFPLLISEEVGAATYFCSPENSYIFQAGSEDEILAIFNQIEGLSNDDLVKKAKKSHEIGMKITPQKWTNQIINLLKNNGEIRD